MPIQGFTATLWVGAEYHPQFENPVNEEKIVESWAPTRKAAEDELQRLREKYDDGIGYIA